MNSVLLTPISNTRNHLLRTLCSHAKGHDGISFFGITPDHGSVIIHDEHNHARLDVYGLESGNYQASLTFITQFISDGTNAVILENIHTILTHSPDDHHSIIAECRRQVEAHKPD